MYLAQLLSKMVCGLSEREIECKLQHMAATWFIPCALRGIIMFFLPFVNFATFAGCTVPSEQIILLCSEAVQSSLPLVACSQQI